MKSARMVILCVVLGLALTVGAAGANQLSTVAVVDVQRIYNSFFRDSQAVRDLERLREQYQNEIDSHLERLEDLRTRRLEARNADDRRTEIRLDEEITELQAFIQELTQRRRRQLEIQQERVTSDRFLEDVQRAIVFVAESKGYTIVLRSDMDGLQWWSSVVDISDEVLSRLRTTTR